MMHSALPTDLQQLIMHHSFLITLSLVAIGSNLSLHTNHFSWCF